MLRRFLWISVGAAFVSLTSCTGKSENLGATGPLEPDARDASDLTDFSKPDADLREGGKDEGETPPEPHCIGDWPESPNAEPLPSIPDITPEVLWTKPVPQAFSGIGFVHHQLIWTGTHLAFTGANKLWILEPDGEVAAIVNLGEVQSVSEPVADKDGTIYFGSTSLYAVRPDGSFKWEYPLGPNKSYIRDMTVTSAIALSPDGILYFAATDGYIRAVRSEDGTTVWKRPHSENLPYVAMGVGDTIFIDHIPHFRATGKPAGGPLMYEGVRLTSGIGLYSKQRLIPHYVESSDEFSVYAFDHCGEFSFRLDGSSSWPAPLVLFEDQILVQTNTASGQEAYIYSPTGGHRVGPQSLSGTPWLFGADGTLYSTECPNGDDGLMLVTAHSQDLELSWSLNAGAPCLWGPPALADDGTLYFLRVQNGEGGGGRITAIRTASPGLATTSNPAAFHNNRRTRWLGE